MGTKYNDKTIKIDPVLEKTVPEISAEYKNELQANLRRYGYDLSLGPIVLWQPDPNAEEYYIADGHHRWKLCKDLHMELPDECFTVRSFEDRDDVITWMQRNAISQRQMTKYDQFLMGKRYLELLRKCDIDTSADLPRGDKRKKAAKACGLSEGVFSQYLRVMASPYSDLKEKLKDGLTTPYAADETRKKRDQNNKEYSYPNRDWFDIQIKDLNREVNRLLSYHAWQEEKIERAKDKILDLFVQKKYSLTIEDLDHNVTKIYFHYGEIEYVLYESIIVNKGPTFDIRRLPEHYQRQIREAWTERYEKNVGAAGELSLSDLPKAFIDDMLEVLQNVYDPDKIGTRYTRVRKNPEFQQYVFLMRKILEGGE